jgi:hypothetical protein
VNLKATFFKLTTFIASSSVGFNFCGIFLAAAPRSSFHVCFGSSNICRESVLIFRQCRQCQCWNLLVLITQFHF